MKRIVFLLALFMLPLLMVAQNNFNSLYKNFKDKKGVTVVQLDKDIIDLYKSNNIDKESEEVIRKLKEVNILNISIDKNYNSEKNIDKIIKSCFKFDKYQLIKSRIDEWGFAKVYIKKKDTKVRELLVMNSNHYTYNIILIIGDIELSKLNKLASALNIDGLENINEINKNRTYSSNNSKVLDIDKIKEEAENIKKRTRNWKKEYNFNFDDENFEEAMEKWGESFGKMMENWGESFGENIENMMEHLEKGLEEIDKNIIIDDDDYSVTINNNGKTTIKLSPDNNAVYIIDGRKVANSSIKKLNTGEINRITVKKNKKNNSKFVIITTKKKMGKFISFQNDILKFKYMNKIYSYNIKDSNFVGFVYNGKKKRTIEGIKFHDIVQIRIINSAEKIAINSKKDRIIVETR